MRDGDERFDQTNIIRRDKAFLIIPDAQIQDVPEVFFTDFSQLDHCLHFLPANAFPCFHEFYRNLLPDAKLEDLSVRHPNFVLPAKTASYYGYSLSLLDMLSLYEPPSAH